MDMINRCIEDGNNTIIGMDVIIDWALDRKILRGL